MRQLTSQIQNNTGEIFQIFKLSSRTRDSGFNSEHPSLFPLSEADDTSAAAAASGAAGDDSHGCTGSDIPSAIFGDAELPSCFLENYGLDGPLEDPKSQVTSNFNLLIQQGKDLVPNLRFSRPRMSLRRRRWRPPSSSRPSWPFRRTRHRRALPRLPATSDRGCQGGSPGGRARPGKKQLKQPRLCFGTLYVNTDCNFKVQEGRRKAGDDSAALLPRGRLGLRRRGRRRPCPGH